MRSPTRYLPTATACVLLLGLGTVAARAADLAPGQTHSCGGSGAAETDPAPSPGDHLVSPPKAKPTNLVPRLPKSAKAGATSATVEISARVTRHGDVSEIRIVSGAEPFLSEVVKAVCHWKYEPAKLDGVPFAVWKPIKISPAP